MRNDQKTWWKVKANLLQIRQQADLTNPKQETPEEHYYFCPALRAPAARQGRVHLSQARG